MIGEHHVENVARAAVTTYRYDARGALASVTLPDASVLQYRNDPQGRRIERSYGGETRRWLYDGLRIVREEIGPTPTGGASFAASVVRTFVFGTRGHVPDLVVQGSATYRVVTDHLGSVRQVVDTATGDVVAARSYDAWGRVTSDTTSGGFVALPQAYAGGLYDAQTGLVRFGARDYDSVLGRWTAKDPLGFGGGDSGLYGYVTSNPVASYDSTGLWPEHATDRPIRLLARLLWQAPQIVLGDVAMVLSPSHQVYSQSSDVDGMPQMILTNVTFLRPFTPAITLGPWIMFTHPEGDYRHFDVSVEHELAHRPQSEVLGWFYLPINAASLAISAAISTVKWDHQHHGDGDALHEYNIMERGPMGPELSPPRDAVPWRCGW